jgi:hypothetical protein
LTAIAALLTGLAVGAHAATWGMFKDVPYEGFTARTYSRSVIVGGAVGLIVGLVGDVDPTRASGLVVLFGLTYAIERALVEFYKTFLRDEDQSKYFIPMQVAVGGHLVAQRSRRAQLGVAYGAVVAAVVLAVYAVQHTGLAHGWASVLLAGSVGGWISAFGGAWKDAPHEGFSWPKFFRSPLVSLAYAMLLAAMTRSLVFATMGGLGYTVATLETYKTFFKPSTPRGKFAGKEVRHPELLRWRLRFVPVFVAIWVAVIVTFMVAFTESRSGLV